MHISARTEYAVRAMLVVADAHPGLVKTSTIAKTERISLSFLAGILMDLRRGGLLLSTRGTDGGHRLARPADTISVGDVLRAADGVLMTTVHGRPAAQTRYDGSARGLRKVWLSLDLAIMEVVNRSTLADLLASATGPPARAAGPDGY